MPNKPPLTALPEAVERIRKEAEENDAIYRARGVSRPDLSTLHYGHKQMLAWAFKQLGTNLNDCRVLDVGVGEGHSSILLAQQGARVTCIDVSCEALARAVQMATRYGVEIDAQQMAGECLRFGDQTFDAVLCVSAFHHMDLDSASREFARVLQPRGRAVLMEPLATNPPAWIYRRLIRRSSRDATSEERPLRLRDLVHLRRYFGKVSWRGMFLMTIPLFALDRIWDNGNPYVHRATGVLFDWFFPLDEALMRLPGVGYLAWKVLVVAEK